MERRMTGGSFLPESRFGAQKLSTLSASKRATLRESRGGFRAEPRGERHRSDPGRECAMAHAASSPAGATRSDGARSPSECCKQDYQSVPLHDIRSLCPDTKA